MLLILAPNYGDEVLFRFISVYTSEHLSVDPGRKRLSKSTLAGGALGNALGNAQREKRDLENASFGGPPLALGHRRSAEKAAKGGVILTGTASPEREKG